ncbi:MAG TPA: winged helix-turn-helix domain-containing protein [Candidatus Saccharimonadales bacterium]|nr:winged helix-turn-helix domain-containing protein [Candidatus Saccharimonadales bacterium]
MANSTSSLPSMRFGPFEFDADAGELRKGGQRINVHGQPLEILAVLLERAGQVVSRDELRTRLWPGDTFVDFDHSLNAAVNKLREALGDSAVSPQFIETIPRRGYRFSAVIRKTPNSAVSANAQQPVALASAGLAEARRRRHRVTLAIAIALLTVSLTVGIFALRRPAVPAVSSIAVLPFSNLSRDSSQEYFADGMTDTLITELAQIQALRVISRTTAMQYKATKKTLPQIAQQLGVEAVVEGSVQRSGDHVRVTAELVYAPRDRLLWAQSYERDLRDVLALENEVAQAIVKQIHGQLKPGELARSHTIRPVDPEAQEDYLKGLYYWARRPMGLQKGIGFFQRALEREPTYASAYAGLALSYATMGSWENGSLPPRETMPKAKAAAQKALELDDTLSQAHAALAYVHLHYDWEWAAAEREFQRSLQLNNNDSIAHHWYSHFLTAAGRNTESLAESRRAQQLDPLDPSISIHLAWLYYYAHQYDDVVVQSKEVIEAATQSFWPHFDLGLAYEQKGMFQEAISEFQKAREISPSSTFVIAGLGHTHAVAGHHGEAMRILVELAGMSKSSYVSPFDVAVVYAGSGDNRSTLRWLEKALAERSGWLVYLKYDPRFEPVRSDPGFQDLVRRVGPNQ